MANKGKKFETKFKEDFKRSFPFGTIDRLYDQMSGYKTIANISDFIGYNYPVIMYLECKSHQGNTFPFSNLTQYEDLTEKVGIHGVRVGVVLWMIDYDSVIYVPIKTITKMKEDGLKSINMRTLNHNDYRYFDIPSKKKRVFMDSDYSVLANMEDGD